MILLERSDLVSGIARRLTLGTALVCSLLAPILLGAGFLEFPLMHAPRVSAVLRFFLISIPLAGLLGGLVMHLAVQKRSAAKLVRNACFGGVLFLTGTVVLHMALDGAHPRLVFGVGLFSGTFGSVISAPCGFLFGLAMRSMFETANKHPEAPAQDSQLRVAQLVAWALLAAAGFSLLATWLVEGPYEVALSHWLSTGPVRPPEGSFLRIIEGHTQPVFVTPEGSALAWTRFLFAAPLALVAALLWAYTQLQAWKFQRERAAIRGRTHETWSISDLHAEDDAMPLTEADRRSTQKRLLEPLEGGLPYRETPHVRVYVGLAPRP